MATRQFSIPPVMALPAEPSARTQILSIVCAITGQELDISRAIQELHQEVVGLNALTELVVILNGPDSDAVEDLRLLTRTCDRLQIYVTKRRVDYSTALMVGIENAIGDWVATIDVEADDPTAVGCMFEAALREKADIALSVPGFARRPFLDSLMSQAFHGVFRVLHGYSLTSESPSARVLSRAVVNSLLCDDSPLIAFETLTGGMGYRKCFVPSTRRKAIRRGIGERARIRWRTLIGIDAVPLRLANLLSGVTAAGALFYSIYALISYMMRDNIVPGWTTLSLMLSGMFMMVALVLWLLSEYMLILLDPGARRPRYEISDEFGGRVRVPGDTLNVETEL